MAVRVLFLACLFFLLAGGIANQESSPLEPSLSEAEVNTQVRSLTQEMLPELIARATDDDVEAQCVLGVAYADGVRAPHDDREGIKWLRKAAAKDIAWIQDRLATMYHRGEGTARDDSEAVRWYRIAAEGHEPRAEYNLAYMYFQGYGVHRDHALAVKLYRRAAEHGHIGAQDSL